MLVENLFHRINNVKLIFLKKKLGYVLCHFTGEGNNDYIGEKKE